MFEGEIIHAEYCILNKWPDFYFPAHKRAIEVDEYDHVDRVFAWKKERQMIIEKNWL